jgi:hypothetical protein
METSLDNKALFRRIPNIPCWTIDVKNENRGAMVHAANHEKVTQGIC